MQAKGAARLQSAFGDCCIGDCRPLLQSVTITNHLSLFGHMNSLEFSLNTARGRTVDGELVTELLLQEVGSSRPSGERQVGQSRRRRSCKNVSASGIRILIQIYSAGQICFREIDNFTTARPTSLSVISSSTNVNTSFLKTITFAGQLLLWECEQLAHKHRRPLFVLNRHTSRERRCQV